MTITIEELTPQEVLGLAQKLSLPDRRWLIEQLNLLIIEGDDEPLPESATLDKAIELYLSDKCSLGRAAELAGVTQWEIKNILHERGTPVRACNDYDSIEEMDERAKAFWTHLNDN